MGKNNLEEQIIKKILTRSESINLLLDYYDDEDIINIYIFDIIAYILNSSKKRIIKMDANNEVDNLISVLLLDSDSANEIEIKCSNLKDVINVIDNYNLSENILDILQRIFIYNEMIINYDYKLNSKDVSLYERVKLTENLYSAKREMRNLFIKLEVSFINNIKSKNVIFYKLKEIVNSIINIDKKKYYPIGWKKKEEKNIEDETEEKRVVKPKK